MQGLLASLLAGVVTGVGGFMIFLKKKYSQEYIRIYLRYSWLYFYLHLALYHSFYFPVIFIIRRFYSPIKRTLYLSYFISILNSLAAFSCGIFTARFPFSILYSHISSFG